MPERGPVFGWLALLPEPRTGSVAVTTADGSPGGHLLLAVRRGKPDRDAVRVAPDIIESGAIGSGAIGSGAIRSGAVGSGAVGEGPGLAVSLVLPPRGTRPLFDDPAVVEAMRAVLRDPGRTVLFSTLVDGSTQWAGSVSATAAATTGWWRGDPFARLGPQHRLFVPPGVLRPVPLPAGPCHQRHAGTPWPWGRF
ncbi:MAG TPA: hypothetical protein VGE11_08670 [Pseudonocardia sp.]